MITRGEYVANKKAYGVILNHTKQSSEAVLVENNTVVSAYKIDITGRYSYNNTKAKDLVELVLDGVKGCKAKNGQALPWEKGTLMEHIFTRKKVEYTVQLYRNELIGMYATKGEDTVRLERSVNAIIPKNIPYIQLTDVKKDLELSENELDAVPVRSVEEIALEKEDVSWLKKKKYYIVNNDEDAEKLFTFLDNYNGVISYDTETTGLKINCFGKIGSSYMADLEKYNAEHPDDKVRADRLVGIIFCVEPDVSYYFPCFNRKFKNLYEDKDSPVRKKIIQNIRARYTVGPGVTQNHIGDMLRYIRNTPDDELRLDVILMERVRHILETKHIVTHHGSFEWKVDWMYEIDTNLKDDSMLMHQLMYKFRSTTANSGEPSNLKYLTKVELGIEQWELKDFFPNWKEDKKGTVRMRKDAKNRGTQIDFSYMDYEGARVYAPADGDFTLQLVLKYKKDMIENHAEMMYIYDVEMLVSCAIGYMEFYGHRLNESKILGAREDTRANILMIEHEIRKSIQYNSQAENSLYEQLVDIKEQIKNEADHSKVDNDLIPKMTSICEKMREVIDTDEDHAINLSAPGQVADLFYNKLGYPMPGDKMSVAKKELKALVKERDSEGNLKYPVASMYSKYKNETTLMTKFFDNLPYFMYPGGFIFSSYGQIATATGRMSCIEENEPIMIPGGTKPIKDMQIGDLVYCYDKNNNLVIRKVTNVIDKGTQDCVEVSWKSTGCDAHGKLVCTPDHKILTKTRGWVQAKDLTNKERVYHARRSCSSRPVIYSANGKVEQEQLLIKRDVFKTTDTDLCIHPRDGNCSNNSLDNLEIITRNEHSRKHANALVKEGRIKTEHLKQYTESVLSGEDHPNYKKFTADELRQMLIDAHGVLTKVPMTFNTYKEKCALVNFDYMEVVVQFFPKKREVELDEFIDAYFRCDGVIYRIANELKLGRTRVQSLIRELCLDDVNHEEIDISHEEYTSLFFKFKGDTSKLSGYLGMSSREIQKVNRDFNLVYTGIPDNEFEQAYMDNKGSIRAVAKQFGITFYKAKMNVLRLNLCYNHMITCVEPCGERHVYDLEVEDCHNFIASEICVHNCNKPNAQQYPKVITKIVVPRDDYVMVDADYSQIEYRVLTALAKNEGLAKLFADPDSDYHTLMASLMYDVPYASVTPQMRSAAKSFNFGIPYGMGFGSLAILLTGKKNKQTIEEAKEKYEMYFKNQPKTRAFFADIKEMAQVHKYTKTLFNRYRYYTFTDKDGNVNEGRKAAALRQAGNAVIQGTAADIFKISVARNFDWIRRNKLLGLVLIINMIHDEQLMEINSKQLNVIKALGDIGVNMQFNIDGFPPLFIGAGCGPAWGYAKGKMAEIHPTLLQSIIDSTRTVPLFKTEQVATVDEDQKKIADMVYEFRRSKVASYLSNPENWHKVIHPAIGGLINLQFNYGRGDDAKAYVGPNGETYSDSEFLELNIADFLKENSINADAKWFSAEEMVDEREEEADSEYDDSDDDEVNPDEFDSDLSDEITSVYQKIEEDNSLYGSDIADLVKTFGCVVLPGKHIIGFDVRGMGWRNRDALIDWIEPYTLADDNEDSTDGAMEIAFFKEGDIFNKTGIYVAGINPADAEKQYKVIKNTKKFASVIDYKAGDIHNRSQAK